MPESRFKDGFVGVHGEIVVARFNKNGECHEYLEDAA
jgi:hypothetical protein